MTVQLYCTKEFVCLAGFKYRRETSGGGGGGGYSTQLLVDTVGM